jgi:hypothetical protein
METGFGSEASKLIISLLEAAAVYAKKGLPIGMVQ